MTIFIEENDLNIQSIKKEDELHLLKWLTNDEVLSYYEGRDNKYTINKVRNDFLVDDYETRCLIYKDSYPIGYIQFYQLNEVRGISLPANSYGMDQFIGEPRYWNKGIGTRIVAMVLNYIIEKLKGSLIVMDPQAWNTREITCYENVGFVRKCMLSKNEFHEGKWRDCYLMVYDPCEYNIQPILEDHQEELQNLFTTLWGSTEMVISSGVYDLSRLSGFIAYNESGDIIGMITYYLHESFLEIISLDSLVGNNSIGSRLLMEVEILALMDGLNEIVLLTTNDNLKALRFYQRKGYRLTSIKSDAVNQARVQKPEIPIMGYHQIPIHDELELRKKLDIKETV
ncbi:GNAT family N-acetyltransferase [Bacillus sp. NTK071]|uniref:GNAT family N-acetyltransferase n=1 Tax=Bacillus sp. NTK071 TaxID=2802175 RepID=UPI001A903A99|nr:GNAT family N-acetyltransferase [Bacillus sp. NTK071]